MNYGVNLGATLVQQRGSIGGSRNVFVKLQGVKNDLVFPTFGAMLQNPFANGGKIYAGDLFEYRTDDAGLNPVLYLLKTFEVKEASSAANVKVINDGYHHIPSVGDVLMAAPASLTGTGTAVTVTAVAVTEDAFELTLSAALGTLKEGDVLVEAEEAGSGKKMLVKNPNSWAACDYDLLYPVAGTDQMTKPRYMITPTLHAIAYTKKMSALPACVKALNKSRINGWFEL